MSREHERPPLPPSLVFVGVGVFTITVAAHVRAPLLPEMGRDLAMGPAALGAFVAVFALGRIIADIPAGRLTDSRPSRSMLAIAATIVASGSLLAGAAPTSAVAFVAAFGLGVGSAWTNTTGIAAFAEAPRQRRGVAMSGFATALLVGQAVGPAFGGAIAALSSWRVAFGAAAVLGLAMALLLMRPPRTTKTMRPMAASDSELPAIRRSVRFALYLLPAVQFAIGGALLQTLVPIVGDGEFGLGVGVVGAAIGVAGLLRLVGALVSGRISDAYSRRWALLPGLAMQLVGLGCFAAWSSLTGWWLAIILTSLGSSGVNVGATILADLSEGARLGPQLAMFRLTGDVALLAAPLLAGVLYETSGKGLATLPLIVFVAVVTVMAAVLVPDTREPARLPHPSSDSP